MSRSTARIVWFDKAEWSQEWRRFVACLCFMLFYVEFVLGGTTFWVDGLREFHRGEADQRHFWMGAGQVCAACAAYICGRSLWYQGRFTRWWLAVGVLSLLGLIGLETYYSCKMPWFRSYHGFAKLFLLQGYAFKGLPFLVTLVVSFWLSNWPVPMLSQRYRRWVIVALAWCIGVGLVPGTSDAAQALSSPDNEKWGLVIGMMVLCALSVFLLCGARLVRLIAIAIAVGELAVVSVYAAFGIAPLVESGITSLYLALPARFGQLPSPFPFGICYLNRWTFRDAFVGTVLQAGPWILIAIYARRYPMRVPPEDGSPWPRRYCGRCGYNLHGTSGEICPECGCELRA